MRASEIPPRDERVRHLHDIRTIRQRALTIDHEQRCSTRRCFREKRVRIVIVSAKRNERFAAFDRARIGDDPARMLAIGAHHASARRRCCSMSFELRVVFRDRCRHYFCPSFLLRASA